MTDTSDTSSARGMRTTPEAIAERSFSQVKRGYSESEVRAYLRMVSSEFATVAARERDLAARVQHLEEQARKPALPPTEQELISALGEETARVLGQARESAAELRNKAEEHARRVVREAQETARELRTTTQQAVETKTREAEDAARSRAKEIVGEARALRDRVLADLDERRRGLEQQIADLRASRGKLVETYELVERALGRAAKVMADEPSTAPEVPRPAPVEDVPEATAAAPSSRVAEEAATGADASPKGDTAKPVATDDAPADDAMDTPAKGGTGRSTVAKDAPVATEADAPAGDPAAAEAEAPTTGSRDVGALFQKLRSGAGADDAAGVAAPDVDAEATPPGDAAVAEAVPAAAADETTTHASDASDGAASDDDVPDDGAPGERDPATAARDEALAATAEDLVRRGKRALQDEQNDMLDGLRRQRGKIDTTKVLPSLEDQVTRWAHVLQPAIDRAYSTGAGTVEGTAAVSAAPRALLTELSTGVVTPLRERLAASLESADGPTPADLELAVAQSLGARYREWRGEPLENALGDVLAVAWSRGVFDAAPDGARLRWVPAVVGKCPDCDDNALEPTVKGSDFPTGQQHPPAHPGCRCLLVVHEA